MSKRCEKKENKKHEEKEEQNVLSYGCTLQVSCNKRLNTGELFLGNTLFCSTCTVCVCVFVYTCVYELWVHLTWER